MGPAADLFYMCSTGHSSSGAGVILSAAFQPDLSGCTYRLLSGEDLQCELSGTASILVTSSALRTLVLQYSRHSFPGYGPSEAVEECGNGPLMIGPLRGFDFAYFFPLSERSAAFAALSAFFSTSIRCELQGNTTDTDKVPALLKKMAVFRDLPPTQEIRTSTI